METKERFVDTIMALPQAQREQLLRYIADEPKLLALLDANSCAVLRAEKLNVITLGN